MRHNFIAQLTNSRPCAFVPCPLALTNWRRGEETPGQHSWFSVHSGVVRAAVPALGSDRGECVCGNEICNRHETLHDNQVAMGTERGTERISAATVSIGVLQVRPKYSCVLLTVITYRIGSEQPNLTSLDALRLPYSIGRCNICQPLIRTHMCNPLHKRVVVVARPRCPRSSLLTTRSDDSKPYMILKGRDESYKNHVGVAIVRAVGEEQ